MCVTVKVSDTMRENVRKAVAGFEHGTAGEMVCVVAPASARYVLFPLLQAALIALILPGLNTLAAQTGHLKPLVTFPLQTAAFVLLAALFACTPLKMALTPRAVRLNNCRRSALEQFFAQNLHDTAERTGILLYVSVAERHVEIVADKGISDKVAKTVWEDTVRKFIADLRAGKTEEGFISAIQSCRKVVAAHFPARKDDVNELPDQLVELPLPSFVS